MASPQSTSSQDAPKALEQITFRFCSECSNMLYPQEDEHAHELKFTCRTCQFTENAQSTCVFRNILNNSAGETAGVTQDVASDPTVSQAPLVCLGCDFPITCVKCAAYAECAFLVVRGALPDDDVESGLDWDDLVDDDVNLDPNHETSRASTTNGIQSGVRKTDRAPANSHDVHDAFTYVLSTHGASTTADASSPPASITRHHEVSPGHVLGHASQGYRWLSDAFYNSMDVKF
ncbi:RNA polymerase M/15 kDa subunit [Drechmeria coniospora]|uniref:RNA polymerase M/15 kDa subunit n=1 Tax=Drechmeria coniospora TaxID=98403 RepID=A0A151GH97_DRECN|nr:RNA polymerase M/15 kDa subunit [Drechmeria coniospora]KYK56448.1 RNA polymerase M/15 kDa subunit [Drechmeria coniospora]ODA76894.1 hypothetical protein RJ55_07410 [Drechmeria coniospora]